MSTDGQMSAPPQYAPQQQQPQYGQPQPQYAQQQPQYAQPQQYGQPQQVQQVQYATQPQYAQQQPQYAQPVQYGQPQQVFVQSPGQQVVYQQSPTLVTQTILVNAAIPFTPFQTGLCDCCQDPGIFILACLVPCWVAGLNEELKTGPNPGCGCTFLTGLCIFGVAAFLSVPCVFNWWLGTRRSDTRYRYRIAGDACEDFCCHCCCMACALTQENLEIKKRKIQQAQQAPVAQVMAY